MTPKSIEREEHDQDDDEDHADEIGLDQQSLKDLTTIRNFEVRGE
jgi:hypothetical protein